LKKIFGHESKTSKSGWAMALSPTMTIPKLKSCWPMSNVPIVGVGGSYHQPEQYPPVHYIATDNAALVESAFLHLKEKACTASRFTACPPPAVNAGP
jgi:DNA-binding LacI/PurR family transcriptional regulator